MAHITYPEAQEPTVFVLDGEYNPAYYLDRGTQAPRKNTGSVNYPAVPDGLAGLDPKSIAHLRCSYDAEVRGIEHGASKT